MKLYLAHMKALGYDWEAFSTSEPLAKETVFKGLNTFICKQIEHKRGKGICTHEFLEKELEKYYKKNFGGNVSVSSLENKHSIDVIEISKDECYRNGYKVPSRVQDM